MLRHATLSLVVLTAAAPSFAGSFGGRVASRGSAPHYSVPSAAHPSSSAPTAPGFRAGGYGPSGYAPSGYRPSAPSYPGSYGYRPAPPSSSGFSTTRYSYGTPPPSGYGYAGGYSGYRGSHRYGYYSGGYVPRYGYGYSYYYAPAPVVVGGVGVAAAPEPMVVEEEVGVRVTAGVEGTGFLNSGNVGGTLGVGASLEAARWGFAVTASDIMTPYADGVSHVGDVTAHLTFAFITGKYGRLRAEAGADGFFGQDMILVGPTGGLSGVVWLGGPVGIEGSVMATPWPFLQVDGKLGLAVGVGQFGLRAGWRVLAMSDRGIVNGIEHSQLISGPYVGLSVVF